MGPMFAADVVAVDEVEFAGPRIVSVPSELRTRGLAVICGNWNTVSLPMRALRRSADILLTLQGTCVVCGRPAARTQRIGLDGRATFDGEVVEAGIERYQPRCLRRCELPLIPDGE
jgi:thymidine kinase